MRKAVEPSSRVGRRPSTSRGLISDIAIDLFATQGFDETSVDEIAEAAGIARRTFFRYFASKNAVPWGDFDAHLDEMRQLLRELPDDVSLADGLASALLAFNNFPPEEAATHRQRMELILRVPALQGYSMVMYEGWRRVVAEHVAARAHCKPDDHLARTVGWIMLGTAIAAYEQWLTDDSLELPDLLAAGSATLSDGLAALTVSIQD